MAKRSTNYKLVAVLSYPAQFNIMLKYKNVEFLQTFAKKRALLFTFVKFLLYFCTFLHHLLTFFSCPFYPNRPCCQSTSICRPKTNIPNRRTKKKRNFPTILNFKKFHFSIMLICAIYAQGIFSTFISCRPNVISSPKDRLEMMPSR